MRICSVNNYFLDTGITVTDNFLIKIKKLIDESKPEDWIIILQMTLLPVPESFFDTEPALKKIIDKFDSSKRLAIYKTSANTVYHWHRDSIRNASLNILIDGYDSMCMFANAPVNGMMSDLKILNYVPGHVHLLNVSQLHTVINFNSERYLLSIGVPFPATFEDVKQFIENN